MPITKGRASAILSGLNNLADMAATNRSMWLEQISTIGDSVGRKITIEDDEAIKEIVLWRFVVMLFRLLGTLYPKPRDENVYKEAVRLLEQKGIATQEEVSHYLLQFRAAGRFKGWPEGHIKVQGLYGHFAAVPFARLFGSDPYSELEPRQQDQVFRQLDAIGKQVQE